MTRTGGPASATRDTVNASGRGACVEITVVDDPAQHRFEVRVDGTAAGYAFYRQRPGLLIFTHTEVADDYRGAGVGGALAKGALDRARERGVRIVPRCPFIAGYLREHQEYADLVAGRRPGGAG